MNSDVVNKSKPPLSTQNVIQRRSSASKKEFIHVAGASSKKIQDPIGLAGGSSWKTTRQPGHCIAVTRNHAVRSRL